MKLALVGGETLLGKEIEEVIKSRTGARVLSFSASGEGNFGDAEGEAVYLEPLNAKTAADARAIVLAETTVGANKSYDLAKSLAPKLRLIDTLGQLEQHAEARMVAPLVSDAPLPASWLLTIAHPAASAMVLLMKRMAHYRPLLQIVATIFEPASEQGKRGVSELHEQTRKLLSFKPLKKEIFDAQLSFNLLSQYGAESSVRLSSAEERIGRHVASILASERDGSALPLPSLRLVGAPVFHGYSLSLWAKFDGNVDATELGEALASAQVEVRGAADEAPDTVSAAGQSGLIAGDIRADHSDHHAAWLWVVGDNLRLTADAVGDVIGKLKEPPQ